MIYLALLLLLAIAYSIQFFDNKAHKRSLEKVEQIHSELYDLIDEYYGDMPNVAKERKAMVDVMVHEHWRNIGREYETDKVDEVTSATERKERAKRMRKGECSAYSVKNLKDSELFRATVLDVVENEAVDRQVEYIMSHSYLKPCTFKDGRERAIKARMETLGMTYEEAVASVDKFDKAFGITKETSQLRWS